MPAHIARTPQWHLRTGRADHRRPVAVRASHIALATAAYAPAMAGLAEWWHSMPRSKQLLVALAAFCLAYLCAAIYEWIAPGGLVGASYYALDPMTAARVSQLAAEANVSVRAAGGITSGDLIVLMAAIFIAGTLGTVAVIVWRETHERGPEPGMGDGDDPLWSGGFDMDMAGDDPPVLTA